MWWLKQRRSESEPIRTEFEKRVVSGVPSVFTGENTTVGEMREMARDIRDHSALTPTEAGLAISLLAVLDMYEREANE